MLERHAPVSVSSLPNAHAPTPSQPASDKHAPRRAALLPTLVVSSPSFYHQPASDPVSLPFPSSPVVVFDSSSPRPEAENDCADEDALAHLPSKLRLRKIKAAAKLRERTSTRVDDLVALKPATRPNPFQSAPSSPCSSFASFDQPPMPPTAPAKPPSSGAGSRAPSSRRSAAPPTKNADLAAGPKGSDKSLLMVDDLRVPIMPGQSLVFGRKPDVSLAPPPPPNHTVHPVLLPKTFTHASRVHCTCTLTAPPLGGLTMQITVHGQNGLMVDEERFEEGTSAGVELKRKTGEEVELGFYGGKRVVCEVKLEEAFGEGRATRGGAGAVKGKAKSTGVEDTVPRLRPDKRKLKDEETPSSSLPQSPSTSKKPRSSAFAPETSAPSPPARSPPPALDPSILALAPAERAPHLVDHLDLDLPGLCAAAIVFSPRATVKTDDVVRGVLESDPRMRDLVLKGTRVSSSPDLGMSAPAAEVGDETMQVSKTEEGTGELSEDGVDQDEQPRDERTEKAVVAWRSMIVDTLQRSDMFGRVTNDEHVKDASGNLLQAHWFYRPANDPDQERRSTLQPAVKKLRATQLTSKQYFFKKVRGAGGNRRKS